MGKRAHQKLKSTYRNIDKFVLLGLPQKPTLEAASWQCLLVHLDTSGFCLIFRAISTALLVLWVILEL